MAHSNPKSTLIHAAKPHKGSTLKHFRKEGKVKGVAGKVFKVFVKILTTLVRKVINSV